MLIEAGLIVSGCATMVLAIGKLRADRRSAAGALAAMAIIALGMAWHLHASAMAVEDVPAFCFERAPGQVANTPVPGAPAVPAPGDIYLALDTSPSMLLPTTRAGMRLLSAESPGGCAYACHQKMPAMPVPGEAPVYLDRSDQPTAPPDLAGFSRCPAGEPGCGLAAATGVHRADTMWIAQHYGLVRGGSNIELRIDAETRSARCLVAAIRHDHPENVGDIRFQAVEFGFGRPESLTGRLAPIFGIKPDAIPDLASRQPEWYNGSCLTKDTCKGFASTDFRALFAGLDASISRDGGGLAPDRPQPLLLLVTDGMEDQNTPGAPGGRWIGPLAPAQLAQCAALKRRGIRIAILYLPQPVDAMRGNPWSEQNVIPLLDRIEPALKQCATTTVGGKPLLQRVGMDEKIPFAMLDFFATAEAAR